MRIGVTAFLTDRGIAPAELAVAAEERGFHSLWLPEHTHIPVRRAEPPAPVRGVDPDDYQRTLDPLVALATAATVTERLRLGTGVALVAQHDPIALAKAIATLDHLSGGRVTLGVGYGWNREELEDHGVAYGDRREVVAESLALMRSLWADDIAEHHGPRLRLPPAYSWPKPPQHPRGRGGPRSVPVLIGGAAGPKLFAAIAEQADGWMPIGGAGLRRDLPALRQAVADAGRDPEQIGVVPFGVLADAGKLDHYRSLGVDEVVLRVPNGPSREVLPALDRLAALLERS